MVKLNRKHAINKQFPVYFVLASLVVGLVILVSVGMKDPVPHAPSPGAGDDHETDAAVPPPGHLSPPIAEFFRYLDGEVDSTRTVGAACTVVQNGRIVYTGTYGEIRKGSGRQVDEHTIFRLASVSKGFAGTLAALMEYEGTLSLDDRVLDYFPSFRLKEQVNTDSMTIRNLLSHTTGLVPYAFDNLVEAGEELPAIAGRLHEVDISGPPGELYGYQNVTFSLWDPISRKASGTPYQVLVRGKIFEPLGMEDASVGPVQWTESSNHAWPHVRTRSGYAALKPHSGYYNVLPAAGVNASISDLGKWLQALLGHRVDVLPEEVLRNLEEPVIYTPLKYRYTRYWQPFRERYYSLGWRIYQYRNRTIVYHGGYIRGYRAEIAFCPEEDIGIAFLQNSPNHLASKVVPRFFDSFFDSKASRTAVNN